MAEQHAPAAAKVHGERPLADTIREKAQQIIDKPQSPLGGPEGEAAAWYWTHDFLAGFARDALALLAAATPFDGTPGTSSAAGGSWGNSGGSAANIRPSTADKLEVMAHKMTDAELRSCIESIRGNPKRPGRRLNEGEAIALAALMAEEARRVKA